MICNLYSIERFIEKKHQEAYYARHRKPLKSTNHNAYYFFENIESLKKRLSILELEYASDLTELTHQSSSNSTTCGNSL